MNNRFAITHLLTRNPGSSRGPRFTPHASVAAFWESGFTPDASLCESMAACRYAPLDFCRDRISHLQLTREACVAPTQFTLDASSIVNSQSVGGDVIHTRHCPQTRLLMRTVPMRQVFCRSPAQTRSASHKLKTVRH